MAVGAAAVALDPVRLTGGVAHRVNVIPAHERERKSSRMSSALPLSLDVTDLLSFPRIVCRAAQATQWSQMRPQL